MKFFFSLFFSLFFFVAYAQYGFQVEPFQAVPFEPGERPNIKILESSLDEIENNKTEAYQRLSSLEIFIAEYRLKINQDYESLDWFEQFRNNYVSDIKSLITYGLYRDAIYAAIEYKGEIANNAELLARIRTSAEYKDRIYYIQSRSDIDWDTKQQLIEETPYCFVPYKNEWGEIIGGRLGSAQELTQQRIVAKLEAEKRKQEDEIAPQKRAEETAARKRADQIKAAKMRAAQEAAAKKRAVEIAARKRAEQETAAQKRAEQEAAARKRAELEAAKRKSEEVNY